MEILGKIMGNPARIKIMRLFLLNKAQSFSNKEIAKRSRVNSSITRKEVAVLSSVKFIKRKSKDWMFNPAFKYASEFERLLVASDSLNKEAILDNFKKAGKIKLILISGVFIKNKDSRIDILVVGDRLKKSRIEEEMRKLEAEIGTELVYAVFDSKEFSYRLSMYDKLIRDILDFPHEVIFRAKELSTQALKKA
jgi:hypothetical protein